MQTFSLLLTVYVCHQRFQVSVTGTLSDRMKPGIVKENNPFLSKVPFLGYGVLATENKTNTASLSPIHLTRR